MPIQAILQLITAAIPGIANVIVAIKDANGNVNTIAVSLSQADAGFDKTIADAQAWLASHPAAGKPAA